MNTQSEYTAEIFRAFDKSPIFSGLNSKERHDLIFLASYRSVPKNSLLFNHGDNCRNLYFLINGRVKLMEVDPETGRSQVLFLMSSGDIFDFICLLDNGPHSVDAITLDDCELLIIPVQKMHRIIDQYPAVNKALLPYLGHQMRRLAELAAELSLSDTATRLNLLLLRHIKGNPPGKVPHLIHDLSHEEIAGMIGTVRVVVNRHIQHLKKEGILQTHRKFIAIKDLQALLRKVESRFNLPGKNSYRK